MQDKIRKQSTGETKVIIIKVSVIANEREKSLKKKVHIYSKWPPTLKNRTLETNTTTKIQDPLSQVL